MTLGDPSAQGATDVPIPIPIADLEGYPNDVTKVLKGNGTWGVSSTPSLTDAHIFVGNGSNNATDVALSGDATISDTGVLKINNISNVSVTSKSLLFSLAGMTSNIVLTITSAQSTNQSLAIPNITGSDTLATLSLGQTFLAKKIFGAGLLQARDILDSGGLKIIDLITTASAVDFFEFTDVATANPANLLLSAKGTDTNIGITLVPKGTGEIFGHTEILTFALGDESTNKAAGTYFTWVAPRAGQIIWAEQCATVAPTTSAVTLDVDIGGTSIFSTKPTIAATAFAGSNGVLTNNPQTVAKGDTLTFEVDTNDTGTTSAGIKITLGFRRTA